MANKRRWVVIGGLVVALIATILIGGGAVATGEDTEVAITGTALELASDAALEHVGEGRVTDTEVGDEEGFYEVEVTLDDGSEIDVHLDEAFNVLSTEAETPGSEDGADDD